MSVEDNDDYDDSEEERKILISRQFHGQRSVSLQALDELEEEDEEDDEEAVAIDGEGERVYDVNATKPNYKLFSTRGSCLDYHSLILNREDGRSLQPSNSNPATSSMPKLAATGLHYKGMSPFSPKGK